jgi:hypothetical protein
MNRSIAMKSLTTALALAGDDPPAGTIPLKKGWRADVVSTGEPGSDRQMSVWNGEGPKVTLTRFAKADSRPHGFPPSIGYIPSETVWAGEADGHAAAIWIAPVDPAEVAARLVAESVGSGWELESSSNLEFPAIKSVSLRRSEVRRAVSILSGNVVVNEGEAIARSNANRARSP